MNIMRLLAEAASFLFYGYEKNHFICFVAGMFVAIMPL